jgi:hypothetical protein
MCAVLLVLNCVFEEAVGPDREWAFKEMTVSEKYIEKAY